MSLNSDALYATNPQANISRSRFDMSSGHTTTHDSWEIIPVYWNEVLPGDTWTVSTSIAARLQTLLHPIFGDLLYDVTWFYVPNRLLWDNWQRFLGDNPDPWYEDYQVDTPQININFKSRTGHYVGSKTIADYLGCPLAPSTGSGTQIRTVTHLPFRAYARIYNEWWRSENLDNLTAFNASDSSVDMNPSGAPYYGGRPLISNRLADPFSRSLPDPQKGEPVTFGFLPMAPVVSMSSHLDWDDAVNTTGRGPMSFYAGALESSITANQNYSFKLYGVHHSAGDDEMVGARSQLSATTAPLDQDKLYPNSLYADLSQAAAINVNDFRLAVATQHYLEALARGGSRYIEYLANIWNVQAPDQRLQRSEFLGGNRIRLNINQVTSQTSNPDSTGGADLGDVGAYSLTTDSQFSFQKSFVEHGIIMALAVCRWHSRYQNGYERKWFRKGLHTYYNPMLARIGEQPTYKKELYADGSDKDEEVFGYNEAWLEYRSSVSRISAEMRSDISNSLDVWHLADDYSSTPSLSASWLKGDKGILDRVLAVSSSNANQILADFWFNVEVTRAMPVRSIPGLTLL